MEKTYTTREFAEKMGLCLKTLYNWDKNGILVAKRKINGYKYYTEKDVAKVMGVDEG